MLFLGVVDDAVVVEWYDNCGALVKNLMFDFNKFGKLSKEDGGVHCSVRSYGEGDVCSEGNEGTALCYYSINVFISDI